ncbi:MAG: WG repeat-containing protein [Clostridia bacterium]|nr:WG repeat-containing protein [Clostridia bacterium]
MVCRVCKREIDSPVCSFCGEDNTPWIEAARETVKSDEAVENIEPVSEPVVRRKYRIDYKKLVRLIGVVVAIILVIWFVSSLFSSDTKKAEPANNTLFTDGMIAVRSGQEWGYINSDNISSYAITPQYKYVTRYYGNIAFAYIGNKYAAINKAGELLTEPAFEAVGPVAKNGYFAVKSDGKWGYINKDIEYVIEPKFSTAGVFTNGIAAVSVNGSYGYIGTDGEYVIAPQYEQALDFSDGYAAVRVDGKWGYINKDGGAVIDPVYEEAHKFIDGMAIVRLYGDYGVINKKGKFTVEPQFDEILPFEDGYARVKTGNRYGYINKDGSFKINPRYYELGLFGDESLTYAARGDGKYGFVNKEGNFVIEPAFDGAGEFSNGMAPVLTDGLWGYINTDGEMVISPAYTSATAFYSDGYAVVQDSSGVYSVIDTEGTNLFSSSVNAEGMMIN